MCGYGRNGINNCRRRKLRELRRMDSLWGARVESIGAKLVSSELLTPIDEGQAAPLPFRHYKCPA